MDVNKYMFSNEEKKAIEEILKYETQFNINFLMAEIEDNLMIAKDERKYADIYRDTKKILDVVLKVYSAMCKQELNQKTYIDKIYIPISREEANVYLANKEFNGFLVGTSKKIVSEIKPYPEINDLVILEAEIIKTPILNCEDILENAFDDSSAIIGPSFNIEVLDMNHSIFENPTSKEKREYIKVKISPSKEKKDKLEKETLEKIIDESPTQAEMFRKYLKLQKENAYISLTLEEEEFDTLIQDGYIKKINIEIEDDLNINKDAEKLEKENKETENNKENVDLNSKNINKDLDKTLKENKKENKKDEKKLTDVEKIAFKFRKKYFKDSKNEEELEEESNEELEKEKLLKESKENQEKINYFKNKIKEKNEEIENEDQEYKKNKDEIQRLTEEEIIAREINNLEKDLESKTNSVKERINELLNQTEDSLNLKTKTNEENKTNKENLKETKEKTKEEDNENKNINLKEENLKEEKIKEELGLNSVFETYYEKKARLEKYKKEEYIKQVNKVIDENFEEIQNILLGINDWKTRLLNTLKYEFAQTISYIMLEKNTNLKNANLTKDEKKVYSTLGKEIKEALEITDKLSQDISKLIKVQQKFAKIASETNAKYSAIVDGFMIKKRLEYLKEMLSNEEKLGNALYTDRIEKEFTEDEVTEKLDLSMKKIESIEQIKEFLNNITSSKTESSSDGFTRLDEMLLLEENELKRQIFIYARNLIAKGNMKILEDEIEFIETKSPISKVLDFITGRVKEDEYFVNKLDETIELIERYLADELTVEKNYRIHEIVAEIMIFKSENLNDDLVDKEQEKLSELESSLAKNFTIESDKVIAEIEDKKNLNLPVNEKPTKEDQIDVEIASFVKKYGYKDPNEGSKKYEDNTEKEIKKIVDYAKIAF